MEALREGMRIGPYKVEKVLPEGAGGFGRVVLARRMAGEIPQERVALKLALTYSERGADATEGKAETRQQALSVEVEALRDLKHPGIVRLYPILEERRRPAYMARAMNIEGQPWYFAMEYLTGGSVEELAQKMGKLPIKLAAEIIQQVAQALEYAHAKGYYHADIKARNILLRQPYDGREAPEAVLADFGAAKRRGLTAQLDSMSLLHAPPERVQALKDEVSPPPALDNAAVDIYSLGVVFYRLLAGRLPFQGREGHVITAILKGELTRPSQFNAELARQPELEALILEMLSHDPGKRPRVKEVIRRLELLVPLPRFSEEGEKPKESDAKLVKTLRRWRGASVGLFALALLEAAALFVRLPGNGNGNGVTAVPTTPPVTPIVTTATVPKGRIITLTSTKTASATASLTSAPEETVVPATDTPIPATEEPTSTPVEQPTTPPIEQPTTPPPTDVVEKPTPVITPKTETKRPTTVTPGGTEVTIIGLPAEKLSCLTLIFRKERKEVQRVTLSNQDTVKGPACDEVKVEGSPTGDCPWGTHYLLNGENPIRVVGGKLTVGFAQRGGGPGGGSPQPTWTPS